MTGTGLHAFGLQVRLGGREVLSGVDLSLTPGEVVALVGPNGAGKSTLLAALAGDVTPHAGSVHIGGRPVEQVRDAELARLRAVQVQESRLAFAFTVAEVVEMGRAPWQRTATAAQDDAAIAHAMAVTEIEQLAAQPYPTLSGGEKARTAFARVLAQDTGVLLLDEPTAALDIRHQEVTLGRARAAADAGAAVVVVLHDLTLAAAYADRMVLLDQGRVVLDGPPAAVCDPTLLSEVYRYPVTVLHDDVGILVVPVRRPTDVAASHRPRGASV